MNIPDSYSYVRGRLASGEPNWHRIALDSGIPYSTIYRIAKGQVSPRMDTVARLVDYFHSRDAAPAAQQ